MLRQMFRGIVVARLDNWRRRIFERSATGVAERTYATAGAIARLPFRTEPVDLPPPLALNGTRIDVVADLAEYCDLPRETIEAELTTRSFRAEWHATPPELRSDHWYYLSAKGYLFANAVHFPDESFVKDYVAPHVKPGARVLDFGAGTGNLSLSLVAAGYDVAAIELSALQRDFIRFRVNRHGLSEQLQVIDWWAGSSGGSYDAIVAVDVLEHLPDGARVLDEQLLPALKPGGFLIENSPFVVNAANPMHHEDFGLDAHLRSRGLEPLERGEDGTQVWVKRSA